MPDLTIGKIVEGLQFAHLIGLSIGFGGAIFADILGVIALFSQRSAFVRSVLKPLHVFIFTGLCLLLVSGVYIAALKFTPTTIPTKVFVKFVLAGVLLVNAYLIKQHLFPLIATRQTPLITILKWRELAKAVLFVSVSLACWTSALLIVKFTPLQELPALQLAGAIVLFWVLCAVLLAVAVVAGRLTFKVRSNAAQRSGNTDSEAIADVFDRWRAELSATEKPGLATDEQPAGASGKGAPNATGDTGVASERMRSPWRVGIAALPGLVRSRDKAPQGSAAVSLASDEETAPAEGAKRVATGRRNEPIPTINAAIARCRSALTGVAGISIVTNILMLTGPLFMLQIYDRVLTSRSVPTLTALVLLVAGLFCFMGVLELIRSRVLVRIGLRLDRILRDGVFQSVLRAAPATSVARTRSLQDLEQLRQFVAGPGPAALFDLPWTPIYFALIFIFHWVLGVVALAGALILVAISLINEILSRKPVAEAGHQSSRALTLAEAGWRNAEAIHAMGMLEPYRQRWLKEHTQGLAVHTRASDIAGSLSTLSKVSRLFLQSVMLAVGAYLAIQQQITPGVIIAASIIMSRALAPIEQSIANWRGFIAARQGTKRIGEALKELPNDANRMSLPEPKGFISVEKMYAAPPGVSSPVLKGLNFFLRPGDAVAVVGPNGSGKSTLARTLVGVWPVMHGEIRLDGAALSQWQPEQRGSKTGYLPQDVELFDGNVAENIARFDPRATPEAIVAAARKAHVHDLILRLPDGYATRLGESGSVLSGGQRQRIALARALYGDPVFVVLDEPSANLDAEGEAALAGAIQTLRAEGATVVIMAHRARTIEAANLVLVLKDGRQTAFDKKETLMAPASAKKPTNPRKVREEAILKTA